MDWKAFFDVLDHLASHFGGLGRVKSWKKNFRFWISDFFRGWSGGTTVTEVGVGLFFHLQRNHRWARAWRNTQNLFKPVWDPF